MFKQFAFVVAGALLLASLGVGAAAAQSGISGSSAASGEIEFTGLVQTLPEGSLIGTWTVQGLKVEVSADTELKGDFKVGDMVKVEGDLQENGSILAREVKEDRSGPRLHEDRDNRGRSNAADDDGDNDHRGRGRDGERHSGRGR